MKFKTIVLFAFVLMLLSSPVYAPTTSSIINGNVYDSEGAPVYEAEVTALCMDDTSEPTPISYTDSDGYYAIAIVCDANTEVTVTAAKDDLTGYEVGVLKDMGFVIIVMMDDITLIPEFSMIMIPFLMSLAGFVFIRNKSII